MSSTMGLNAALSLFRAEGRLDFGRRHSRNSLGIYAAQDPERVAIEIAHATEAEPAGLVDLAHEVLSHERPARDLVDRAGRRARIATAIAAIQPVVVFVSATIASPAPSASTPQPGRFQALVAAATLTCVAMAWMLRLGRPPFVFLDRRAELTRLTVPAVLDRAALYATAGLSPQVAIRRAAADADSTPEVLIAAWRQGRAAPSPDVLLETASLLRARSEAVLKRRVQRLWQPMLVPYVLLVLPACWLLASILL